MVRACSCGHVPAGRCVRIPARCDNHGPTLLIKRPHSTHLKMEDHQSAGDPVQVVWSALANCWPNLDATSNGMEADGILIRLQIAELITMECRNNGQAAR